MKILLCNDTGTKSHVGCLAVSDAHARMLGRMGHIVHHRYFVTELDRHAQPTLDRTIASLERDGGLMAHLDASDAVVVNGEGTLHHGRGLEYIGLLALARRRGKAALLVNALFQEMDVEPAVLNALDGFFVRDSLSDAYARSRGIRCGLTPDSILAAGFSDRPDTDFGGDLVVTDWHKSRDADVGLASIRFQLDAAPGERRHFFPLHAREVRRRWAGAMAAMGTARIVVTARHHGVYLALMAGVPFVPLESNSWKIQATVESLGLPIRPCADEAGIRAQIGDAETNAAAFAEAGKRLREKLPLPIFDVLGKGGDATSEDQEVARLAEQIATRTKALVKDRAIMAKRRRKEAELRWRVRCQRDGLLRGTWQALRA
ncbi:MAG TPA: polysaccharide pyruvyl transferase family protein [Thermohalobaculum sp.]|nr:polysaccharide pyruvyl transferase family protein [Thermohalobaculum sp.]